MKEKTGVIPQDFIEEVLDRTDIVEIIEASVVLKKMGKNYQGLCPFHKEKTPSFTVSQDKGFYHCFGCNAHGGALKFLQEHLRMDFIPALEMLAERVGMKLPQQDEVLPRQENRERRVIYEILEHASKFYKEQLRTNSTRERAVEYLKGRGLSGHIARDFDLGYSVAKWDSLQTFMASSNFERVFLNNSGMLVQRDGSDHSYDRFRDRIMFPIKDLRGKVIAFGGRLIGDGKPKYLNSPETPVFQKGRELYGLYEARRRTPHLEKIIVVEGYMDVLALAQNGIPYAVATLGTATTDNHIERLFRFVSRIVFCFDGDEAGRKAAWKALDAVLPYLQDGRTVAFLFLPDEEDPDSLVRKEGKDGFEGRLSKCTSFTDFFYSHLESSLDMSTPEGKASLSKMAMPLVDQIPKGVFKQLMVNSLSSRVGLTSETLISASASYQKRKSRQSGPIPPSSIKNAVTLAKNDIPKSELGGQVDRAVSMLLKQPELADLFEPEEYSLLKADERLSLLSDLLDFIMHEDILSPEIIFKYFNDRPDFMRLQQLAKKEQLLDISQFADEFKGIVRLQLHRLEEESKKTDIENLLQRPIGTLSSEEKDLIRRYHNGHSLKNV
ncbi:MAG: DNA primase [OM182 bacterium]|uniref:DNA primase n=1 Tax=OM182 bacterium TaxID=2510334 RepID=A0A520S574_9GAMM|nr:MAG: DNA primase [OM182 bacterium]